MSREQNTSGAACFITLAGRDYPVPHQVLAHINNLTAGVMGSTCLIGEAMRIGNEAVDLIEEICHAETLLAPEQLHRLKQIVSERNAIRAATMRRRAGEF